MATVDIREMGMADYEALTSLWRQLPGIRLREDDSRENMAKFLQRNPGMSFIAEVGGQVVGGILCGHDGRRGFLYHLAVRSDYRRQGIGRALAERSVAALTAAGISKCHLFVLADNREGGSFWQRGGFQLRQDIVILSKDTR